MQLTNKQTKPTNEFVEKWASNLKNAVGIDVYQINSKKIEKFRTPSTKIDRKKWQN